MSGPFTVHEIWNESARTFYFEVRHGETVQTRGRYRLHAEATALSWNKRIAQSDRDSGGQS